MRWLLGLCLFLCHLATAGAAQDRHALVVGIDTYENVNSLMKARNDATSVHAAFEAAGVTSTLLLDPTFREMIEALSAFTEQLGPGDEAIFYFAGHGVQIDGRNFLLMSDIPQVAPGGELLLTSQSLPVDVVLDEIRNSGTRFVMLILDACRDNPFPRDDTRGVGGERGLAAATPPEGTFIMYSAGDGQTALDRLSDDDPDPNSVFTRSLLRYIGQPGLPVHEMARLVRSDVRELAATVGHPQFPAIYDQFDGAFSVVPAVTEAPAPAEVPQVATAADSEPPVTAPATDTRTADPCALALPLWQAIEESDDPGPIEAFIETQGDCEVLRRLAETRLAALTAVPDPVPEPVPEPAPEPQPEPAPQPAPEPQPALEPLVAEVIAMSPAARGEGVTDVITYGPGTDLRILGRAALQPDAQAALDGEFATAPYFGAFALSKGGGWGYSTGNHTLEAARAIALAECMSVNDDCQIYAELLPRGYVAPETGVITLSHDAATNYTDRTTNILYHAMAVSVDGAYSKVWEAPSQEEANAQALAECEEYRNPTPYLPDMPCFLLPPPDK